MPAGIGNVCPIFAANIPFIRLFSMPVDMGAKFNKKPLFGKNKTWRGLLCAVLAGALVGVFQMYIARIFAVDFTKFINFDYQSYLTIFLGSVLGLGAILGDLVESFFKRQFGIKSGKSWFPFDQLDYIVGACLLSSPLVILSVKLYVMIIIVWFLMHIIFSYLGYLVRLKKQPI